MYAAITIQQILERKGYRVWSIEAGAKVVDALRLMDEKNIGAVLVCEQKKITGIFSERDYSRKLALAGKNSKNTLVKEVMTDQVLVVKPDQKVEECLALMTNKFIRHLPVVDKDREVIGIVSIGDIVKELIAEQEFVIDQLVNYISGEKPHAPVANKAEIELP